MINMIIIIIQFLEVSFPGRTSSTPMTLRQVCNHRRVLLVSTAEYCVLFFVAWIWLVNVISEEDLPSHPEFDQGVLPVSGIKLCWVCGSPGSKACSRCHAVTYCGKHHQTIHWKHTHKTQCGSRGACLFHCRTWIKMHSCLVVSTQQFLHNKYWSAFTTLTFVSVVVFAEASENTTSSFLFPESELVTEPEEDEEARKEDGEERDTEEGSDQRDVDCPSLADGKFLIIWNRHTG